MGKKKAPKQAELPVEIPVVGELYEDGENDILKSLLEVPPGENVILYLDCAGGSVYAALTIATLIRLRKLKATAMVLGECSSSAILIFAACQERYVTPRSVFLFHHVRWRSEKDVRSIEAAQWATHFRWLEDEIDRYQAELFGVPHDRFAGWIDEGRFVLGAELVEMGVAKFLEQV